MALASIEKARNAKQEAAALFSRFATVVGIGITKVDDGYGIKVNLQEAPPPGIVLPQSVLGVPVKIEVVGRIRKLQALA
jgi:hypothetical protein